jgi:tRNA pseudouridine55 synthase
MDGLLVVDKPAGPTSHDVVARVRRVLRERRIGHTGTLDPAATGVLALVLGRATRLAQFLSGNDKSYEAVIRLGFSTDTGDAQGRATGVPVTTALPSRDAIDAALDAFRGTFLQQPPAFSAKKVAGKRSHKLARAHGKNLSSRLPSPATVTAHAITVTNVEADRVSLSIDCSAGFYIRSLAHDLGERLGVGGHLVALRRTRSGGLTLGDAIGLDTAEREPELAARHVIPLARMLPGLAPVVLNSDGVRKAMSGRELGPRDCVSGFGIPESGLVYRLLDSAGELVAIARPSGGQGLLHPSVVLV